MIHYLLNQRDRGSAMVGLHSALHSH